MANSRLVLNIDTNIAVGTLRDILSDSASRPQEFAQKLLNFVHGCKAGARAASLKSGVVDSGSSDAAKASLAGTFTGQPTAAQTVTINGVVLTAVAEIATPTNNQFRIGTTPTIAASNLAAAINASTSDALSGVVSASSAAGVCTISCLIPGVIGNSILVSETLGNFTFAGGATALASGSGKLPVLVTFSFGK